MDNAVDNTDDCDCDECVQHCQACQMEAINTTVSVTETRMKQPPRTPLIMMTAARRLAIRASLEPATASLEYKK